jgi:hypothetical protein
LESVRSEIYKSSIINHSNHKKNTNREVDTEFAQDLHLHVDFLKNMFLYEEWQIFMSE